MKPKDVTASKDLKESIKNAKDASKKKKDCYAECDNVNAYEPICAHDPKDTTSKPRTFGNECVLKAHNCEMGTSKLFFSINYLTFYRFVTFNIFFTLELVLKSKGECPVSECARLS